MKLYGQTIVLIPYFDHEGMKQWMRLTFTGEMDAKFMYRQISKFIKSEFNKTVSQTWIKKCCPVLNEYRNGKNKKKRQQVTHDSAFIKFADDWVRSMESNEDEDRADYLLQTGNPEGTIEPVRPLSDSD